MYTSKYTSVYYIVRPYATTFLHYTNLYPIPSFSSSFLLILAASSLRICLFSSFPFGFDVMKPLVEVVPHHQVAAQWRIFILFYFSSSLRLSLTPSLFPYVTHRLVTHSLLPFYVTRCRTFVLHFFL
ncbi:hypothetical protein, unlikely [Trypanosoma brucei gambiense DAL972]|uniref:Uncharacterized protein n=1 Tax=Trypanosoma brucei gambiense (strain MHOM/CI/86/DAL972) TaxID=679716 RepID=C9ZJA3_TRYB9|nr:hypothetical protein, unlikely [Trypanosoma brucei gambiense DAL972]CBH09462.1 hypothetical protein, unlikely [Trypanosoma brucei gambiense DAL972]|eukprot:XP_011771767.1 hypothetical protein, unlikely [Trypanosoma brucei gambiense DAL972]